MANAYNTQQWGQNQIPFGSLQLEQEFDFGDQQHRQQHLQHRQRQQQQLLQQGYGSPDTYGYQQTPLPATNANHQSSSLHGVFTLPPNQQSHSRTSSFGNTQTQQTNMTGFGQGVYTSPQSQGQPLPTSSFVANPTSFDFSNHTAASAALPMQGVDSGSNANMASTFSPGPVHENFSNQSTSNGQHPYYSPATDNSLSLPQLKRQRQHTQVFTDSAAEDPDSEAGPSDQKDGKSKLARACARCKTLKVRCEAKTETEPCKRCFNGGHECIIPGRKVRRTPPKREHLINEIQRQAGEIERLMRELENVSSSKQKAQNANQIDNSPNLQSPVLSSSSTSTSYFGGSDSHPQEDVANGVGGSHNTNNGVVNKAVEDWIAKARESLHEFGAFIGVGGAGMPKSYVVEEDFEDSNSGDEEFVDVSEDLEGFDDGDGPYGVAVEQADGDQNMAHPQDGISLNHKSSASSLGTVGTGAMRRKRSGGESSKPANLPVEASPFGLFGNLSLKNPRSRAGSQEPEEEDKGPGIANEDFFKPTPAPNALGRRLESAQHQAPPILTRGIITPQEAEKLFKIYFDNMNLSVSLLDPVLYTAQRTFYRSPFLFTVICAIASRFYTERPGLYGQVMHYAQLAAGTALISGNKNVEMCQAYILLSLYPVPARKWEDQRSWLYLGLAIRAATDLNLHLPTTAKPLSENHAREMLNRTRVWLNCFNLDRSTGSQYGKPPIISPKDYMANHSENWWSSSQYNMAGFDIHISAYNSELKVMADFIAKIYNDPDHPTGLNKESDFEAIATATDDELKALGDRWMLTIHEQTDMSDPQNLFRTGLLKLAYSYSRLIALSYGFQHAFGKDDGKDENPFLMRCLSAASDVVSAVVNDICRPSQIHYFRHGPEAQSVFVTFASAFLVKLLQPKFASYLSPETRIEIRRLVQQVIDLLGSPEVAIDERHGPKLYSRFLEKLLAKPMAKLDPTSPNALSNGVPLPREYTPTATSPAARAKQRRPKSSSGQDSTPNSASSLTASFEIPSNVYNHPSPSNSLSPPPTEAALSFEIFAPVGGIDPFATENAATAAMNLTEDSNVNNVMTGDLFQPSLPFDDAIVQSWQSLTNPAGWNDISMPDPGFNWMTQFQQNLGMDLSGSGGTYEDNNYMTGPSKH